MVNKNIYIRYGEDDIQFLERKKISYILKYKLKNFHINFRENNLYNNSIKFHKINSLIKNTTSPYIHVMHRAYYNS